MKCCQLKKKKIYNENTTKIKPVPDTFIYFFDSICLCVELLGCFCDLGVRAHL